MFQEFHIAYIYIKMANSPRPGVWALEKSKDNGNTWEPWQYFADHTYECEKYFQTKADQPLETDDQVVCATAYSKIVPLENGEVYITQFNFQSVRWNKFCPPTTNIMNPYLRKSRLAKIS